MTFVAVTDTAPLIHLGEIGRLDLLTLADKLYILEAVYNELEAGGVPKSLSEIEYELVSTGTDSLSQSGLDAGEAAAMAVAKERNAILVTDDLAAREQAIEQGIEVHGSIGIIIFGYSHSSLTYDDAVESMRALQRETELFVTDAVVERGIEILDERTEDTR